jgi:hypothetical protein
MPEAHAQSCPFAFPDLSVCSASDCYVLINVRPNGTAQVLPDNQYGTELGINFGTQSIFQLGDNNARISFGNNGGNETVLAGSLMTPVCRHITSGLHVYTVDMTNGGWLDFSGNNRIELNANSILKLAGGSKINGRLDIQSEGAVGILATDEIAMPNMDIEAEQGITLSGQGNIQIGNLQNQGTSSQNQGIIISADGDVQIGIVDSNDDFSVMAGGDISIEEIRNAGSISLTINPPATGVIRIGGQQTTDNPVMCSPPDDCNGFELDGGGSGGGDGCNTVNPDPNVPNNCGGGTTGPEFAFLLIPVFYRRYRISSRP